VTAIDQRRGVECLPVYCDDMLSRCGVCSSRYVRVKSEDHKRSAYEARDGKLLVLFHKDGAASSACKATHSSRVARDRA
jgi:hypothetical protein